MTNIRPRVILVVDDESDVLDLAAIVLGEEGHRVEKARDGLEALGMLSDLAPDLILLDLKMPGISGAEFMSRYRVISNSPAPVVLMTASPRPEAEAAQLGACGWLAKPFDLDVLVDTVRRHLR